MYLVFNKLNFIRLFCNLTLSNVSFLKLSNNKLSKVDENLTYWNKLKSNIKSFLFLTKSNFVILKNKLINLLTFNNDLFFARLKLKGLGFRLKRYGRFLFRLFLGFNHFFYVHLPNYIYIKSRKKKLIFLSRSKILLFLFFWQVIEIRKLIVYFKGSKAKGFFKKRSFRFIKKLKSFGN